MKREKQLSMECSDALEVANAERRIVLIDNYVDDTVLTLLNKRKANVSASVYTDRISSNPFTHKITILIQYRLVFFRQKNGIPSRRICNPP